MRHQVYGKKLNRDIKERSALFKNLVDALIIHGRIKTTLAKGKAVSSLIEKLVTHAKDGSTAQMRKVVSVIQRKDILDKLTKEIAPKFKDRSGGYIRIIKTKQRAGDNSQEIIMEWSS